MRLPTRPPKPAGAIRLPRKSLVTVIVTLLVSACGAAHTSSSPHPPPGDGVPRALLAEARPIGLGARFHPPAKGPVLGPCRHQLGDRFGVHVEVFAANRVVLVPAGIGVRGPERHIDGRISTAHCFGSIVTLDPTGVLLVRSGEHPHLSALFRSWGEPLRPSGLVGFSNPPGHPIAAFINGRVWRGAPGMIPLTPHAEIVLEVGPHVPPHHSYRFPPGI